LRAVNIRNKENAKEKGKRQKTSGKLKLKKAERAKIKAKWFVGSNFLVKRGENIILEERGKYGFGPIYRPL
jgi:hypothetical protein